MLMKDSSGKKSVTMTAFVIGFIVCNIKLLFAGLTVGDFSLAAFTGSEYGIAIAALGSIYVLRRRNNNDSEKDK